MTRPTFRYRDAEYWQCPDCLATVGWLGNVFAKVVGGRMHGCDRRNIVPEDDVVTIHLSDFSVTPGGITRSDGPFSAEAFLHDVLVPVMRSGETIVHLDLDRVAGLAPNFLEAAFGGLVRLRIWSASEIRYRLRVTASEPGLVSRIGMIDRFIREEDENTD